jgi:hypothetical protein
MSFIMRQWVYLDIARLPPMGIPSLVPYSHHWDSAPSTQVLRAETGMSITFSTPTSTIGTNPPFSEAMSLGINTPAYLVLSQK